MRLITTGAAFNSDAAGANAERGQGKLVPLRADVSHEAAVIEMFKRCQRELGTVSVLANIAGMGSTASAPDTPFEVWEQV